MKTVLDQEPPEEPALTKQYLIVVQSAIKDSVILRKKIEEFFDNLTMTLENMNEIKDILNSIEKYSMLSNINKFKYLEKSLNDISQSNEYIQWFRCFLTENQIKKKVEEKYYKELLKKWAEGVNVDYNVLKQILMNIDHLLNGFESSNKPDTFFVQCIECFIDLCFQQSDVTNSIRDGLLNVKNESFRSIFKAKFFEVYVSKQSESVFRYLNDEKNPLTELIKLDKLSNNKTSSITRDLITVICDQIRTIKKDHILQDTLLHPVKNSLIYVLLFEDAFDNISLRTKIIEDLTSIWKDWEDNGFQLDQINRWAELKLEQQIVSKIWNFIGEYNKKTTIFEEWISGEKTKVDKIFELTASLTKCLSCYCKDASDQNRYTSLIADLEKKIKAKTNLFAKVHADIEPLREFPPELNPIISLRAWECYRKQILESASQEENVTEKKTCLQILQETSRIRREFVNQLTDLYTNTKQSLHLQLEQLFPEKYYIEYDLEKLKTLVSNDIAPKLEIILSYWKDRDRIVNIWKGCNRIKDEYQLSQINNLNILQNVVDIDNQTSSETCIEIYQQYCTHFAKKYDGLTLDLIVQWSVSYDLLHFIYPLQTSDVDDLLEVVNDWDESLINTKTVLDFVSVKRFLDQVNKEIDKIKKPKAIELHDVIRASEKIFKQAEFKSLLHNIESCLKSLPSIQRISTGTTNKEQSKRKRIVEIINKSQLKFCMEEVKGSISSVDYQFDVKIENDNWKAISFDELSNLRDRARLIQYASSNSNNVQNYTKKDVQKLDVFISFVGIIETILQTLTEMYVAGYPVEKQYFLVEKKFQFIEGNYDELMIFKDELQKQLTDWEEELCNKYKRCTNLTYFPYQQLSMIENSLHDGTATKPSNAIYHLLKYVGVDSQSIKVNFLPDKSEKPSELLKVITKIVQIQQDDSLDSQSKDEHEDDSAQASIFIIETRNYGILHAILSLFDLTNISPPIANQLFYCTRYTNWIEIRAFIYRCFYSKTLHQLIQPELLSIVIQDKFVQLLTELIDKSPNQVFQLGIITTVSPINLPLVTGFRTSRIIQILRDQDLLDENDFLSTIQKLIGDHCMLVTSKFAGLGKSAYIENQIRENNKQQIKLPISGDVNIDILLERLRDEKIQSASSPIALHINIGQVENAQQLNEFLYSLLIFRCFRFGQMPVDVARDIPIYIELDSSLHLSNLKEQIIIFKYLKTQNIEQLDLSKLNEKSIEIKWVVNYLQTINDEKVNEKDINEDSFIAVNQEDSIKLLKAYFRSEKEPEFTSWTQLSIFLSIYSKLFSDFSKCGHFTVANTASSSLRVEILRSLLNCSGQFTSLSVETVRNNQRSAIDDKCEFSLNEAIISWKKLRAFILIFNSDNTPLFVYKTRDDIPSTLIQALQSDYERRANQTTQTTTSETKRGFFSYWFSKPSTTTTTAASTSTDIAQAQLERFLMDPNIMTHEQFFFQLTSLSKKFFLKKSTCPNCFKQFTYDTKQCPDCQPTTALIRPNSLDEECIVEFQKLIAQNIKSSYVFTSDNYVKMLLIYLRVQSNLPVLIMGETGCGKTALIECLCQKILDHHMEVFRIHAGITNEKIIENMSKYIERAKACSEEKADKRLWVFFDEFNTTPNIGLIKEIVCERTMLGIPLPNNMVFLGACNPQRRKAKKDESAEISGIKKYHANLLDQIAGTQSSLLYSVVSIPETMLEHVWDYGFLDEETEKNYIEKILEKCEGLKSINDWFECTVEMISESHKYFRKNDDVSSVSLRDAVRFCRFYNWFCTKFPMANISSLFSPIQCASLLALLLCYYFRLESAKKRNDYTDMITDLIKKSKPNILPDSIHQLLNSEKMSLITRMELPSGTAKNNALTDNIFVLFTCIVNKIPVVLCGEPGSSKTSAVQIIISNLKGKKSHDEFFQKLPELVAVSFQGSQNCTSESITTVFERADKYANTQSEIQLLPVIVFDEIGLAEISPHNPLKVLHSELEIERCRHGFVGLSNWRLDASKMNRAVYLSCPEPDLDDLKLTALSLSESMLREGGQGVPLHQSIVEGLAVAYMALCKHMKKPGNRQYFGLRDYYSLIKGIMFDTIQKDYKEEQLYAVIRKQFACNFDDRFSESKIIWRKFCEHLNDEYKATQYPSPTFDQLLHQCLSSRNGRFLMLIGDSETTFDYLQRYITMKYPSMQTRTLIGSTFSGDFLSKTTYTEQYNIRILMDIILDAERSMTLFLRGLGHLYDNLYDLFNQSFAVSAKKKYCRIALGSLYHPRCVIHDEFYCVVFVKRQDLDKYDLPFLNRFEKHLINIDTLIEDRYKDIASQLDQLINQILGKHSNTNYPSKRHLFPEYNDNYTLNLVTDAFNQLGQSTDSINDEQVLKYCQNQLLRLSSFDLPFLLSSSEGSSDNNKLIQQYYEIHDQLSFASFIQEELEKKQNKNLLIYTYTQIDQTINYNDIPNGEECIKEIKLSYIKTELELIQNIKMHYSQTGTTRLLCIRIDYCRDYQHVPILKHIFMNEQTNDSSRRICLIFHLQRCQQSQMSNEAFFDGWSRVMIDDLQAHQVLPKDILMNSSYSNLISYLKFLNIENIFDDLINRCMIQFHYIVTNENSKAKINDRRNRIIEQLTISSKDNNNNNKHLRSSVKNCLAQWIEKVIPDSTQKQFADWRLDLLSDGIINSSSRSFNDAVVKIISLFLDKYLSLLFYYLEKHSLIDSYLFLLDTDEKTREKLEPFWKTFWNIVIEKIDPSIINENYARTSLVFDLHLPYAINEYEVICEIRQIVAQQRQNEDTNLIDFAYNLLISKSFYGSNIDEIFRDPDMFLHYYHDQLVLTENEAHIQKLPTSLIRKLTSTLSTDIKYQLTYLLVYPEELFEIMRLFEISLSITEEKLLSKTIDQRCILSSLKNINNFYALMQQEENIYLIQPNTSADADDIYEGKADPFIEISLRNLIELLISQTVVESCDNIGQLILNYSLFSQTINKLIRYGLHSILNFYKVNSFRRLASFISSLYTNDTAITILREVHRYSNVCVTFNKLEDIRSVMNYLRKIVNENRPTTTDLIVNQTLLKFESELLTSWSLHNDDKCNEIFEFINNDDLWKYSAKMFNFIELIFELSATVIQSGGHINQGESEDENQDEKEDDDDDDDEDEDVNLRFPDDKTRKIEILMTSQIYTRLILDKNYQLSVTSKTNYEILKILEENFENFKRNINDINNNQENHTIALISSIAWLKYYLLHYVYALKNDSKNEIMITLNKFLVGDEHLFLSTIRLYIIKLLCSTEKMTLEQLKNKYSNKNISWIHSMMSESVNQQALNARYNFILPTPLFEFLGDFKTIDSKLSVSIEKPAMGGLIRECFKNQNKTYCFLMWFIHYYTRYMKSNVLPDDPFVRLVETDLAKELTQCFSPIGYKLIYSLCKNFDDKSYFRVHVSMAQEDLHQRLLILNIIAALISFKSTKTSSFLSSFLFATNLESPTNYTDHFKQLSDVTGIAQANNLVLIQMKGIRDQINKQTDMNIHVMRCSETCPWIFFIENFIIPDKSTACPLCNNTFLLANNVLRPSNKPTVRLNKTEALEFITGYIKDYQLKDLSNENQTPKHLSQPLTYHYMDFMTQAVFLFLHELDGMPCSTSNIRNYLRKNISNKFTLLLENLLNIEQSYVWLYYLVNQMVKENIPNENNHRRSEQLIEDRLIIPHTQSIVAEIKQYQSAYLDFIFGGEDEKNKQLITFVNETTQDDNKYPLLNFFNITNIHSIDIIDHFYKQLQLQPNYKINYPITYFIFEHLSDYENIQHLYPIVRFINYLMQQFDHRIKRVDANKKTITDCLNSDDQLKSIFKQFHDAWKSINLEDVFYENKIYKFRSVQLDYNFEQRTKISMFLLNKSNENENMIPTACLHTIVGFHNDIYDYFHSNITRIEEQQDSHVIPIQSIRKEYLFDFGTNKLRKLLVEKCMIINYMYGRSEEILYDFDEVEWTLRNEISCLPKIDMKNIRYFNYQGELNNENMRSINDIRTRFQEKLKLLENKKRIEIKRLISLMDNTSVREMLNSLEYILTYLCTINNRNVVETSTMKTFIDIYIKSKSYLTAELSQQSFASLPLGYIIDLYELVEEHVFDSILRMDIKSELRDKSFSNEQNESINTQFIEMIFNDDRLADCFKNLNIWIDMLKRLLVRLTLTKVSISFDSPLQQYVRRSDTWKIDMKKDDIQTIEINNNILLKHAFIIMKGLEDRLNEKEQMMNSDSLMMKEEPMNKPSKDIKQSTVTTTQSGKALKIKKTTKKVKLPDVI